MLRQAVLMLALGLAATPALAQSQPEDLRTLRRQWEQLHDALLIEAIDGDLESASEAYTVMVRNIEVGRPARSAATYWLGQARWSLGDVDGARDALREGIRTASSRPACLDVLDEIELEQGAVSSLPIRWRFDEPDHGFVHPWYMRDKASIRIERGTRSGPALSWTTHLDVSDARRDDQLHLGLHLEDSPPNRLRFITWAEDDPAWIRLLFIDDAGRTWVQDTESDALELRPGEPALVSVRFADLVPQDHDGPFVAADLRRVVVQNVTAFYGPSSTNTHIFIDDFEMD